jgi:hypothetical protein
MKFSFMFLSFLLSAPLTIAQKKMTFNGQSIKYGNYEVPKRFGTDPNQMLLCVFMNELDSVEMHKYSSLFNGKVKIISFSEYKTGNYNEKSIYRYVLTEDGYTMVEEKTNFPVKSFTMFCIYDLVEGTKHLHNRDRKLDRYFKEIQKRKDENNK